MNRATKITVSTFGTIMGLAGLEHGIGEFLQGSVAPAGLMFPSWSQSEFFRSLGGEPAMSIVPNMLVTGILTILVSLLLIAWATMYVQTKLGGFVFILLCIVMLLVGGGIFPPLIGILLGILATRINAPLAWWRSHFPGGLRRSLGNLWQWSLVAAVIAWLLLLPGVPILAYFFGVDDANLSFAFILLALGSLVLTVIAAFAHDSQTIIQDTPPARGSPHHAPA